MPITLIEAMGHFSIEAKNLPDKYSKLRVWLKWGSRVRAMEEKETQEFTSQVESRVFGGSNGRV
jgi:hypothetical protein